MDKHAHMLLAAVLALAPVTAAAGEDWGLDLSDEEAAEAAPADEGASVEAPADEEALRSETAHEEALRSEAPAPAEPPQVAVAAEAPRFFLAAKAGGLFPQPFSELGSSFTFSLGGGWVIPALDDRLALVADGSYANPGRSEKLSDSRVPGGRWSYDLVQHDARLFLGGQYHFAALRSTWVPYAAAGLQAHLLTTEIDGTAGGEPFGTNRETSVQLGAALRGGLGLHAGPGFVQAELELGLSGLDHRVTGDTSGSSLNALLGYTLLL